MKEKIIKWLEENDFDNCKEPPLYQEDGFINFLKELFISKTEDEIKEQIRGCCKSVENLKDFADCLGRWT